MIKAIIVIAAFLLVLPALGLMFIVLFADVGDDYDPYIEKMNDDRSEED